MESVDQPDGKSSPCCVKISDSEFTELTNQSLLEKWKLQNAYIRYLEQKIDELNKGRLKDQIEIMKFQNSDEDNRRKLNETSRREHSLLMKLALKERENQDLLSKIHELKKAKSDAQLLSTLLDPALNLMFERLKKEVLTSREKVEQMQNELAAWTFTPDSHMGKQLMAKCQALYKENEELGKAIAFGRIGKLEGEIAMQKSFVEDMKKTQMETDDFLYELDEEVEGMQATIVHLQSQVQENRTEPDHSAS